MEAIILAGGFGSRLKSVVPDLPKPMAPVSGKPFLQILLETLAFKKFKRVLLSVHFKNIISRLKPSIPPTITNRQRTSL